MNKIKILITLAFLLLISNVSYCVDFHITAPGYSYPRPSIALGDDNCWPVPVILNQNQSVINVTFDITGANSTDCYSYIINVIQFNNTNTVASGTNCNARTISEQVSINNFCFNTDAEIKVIVTYNNSQNIKSRFVRLYSELSSTVCPSGQAKHAAVWSRNVQNLGNLNFGVSHINPCGMSTLAGSVTKYKVTLTANGNFQNKQVVVDNNLSYGFSAANANPQYRWAWRDNITNNQAVFYTYVYWFTIPNYGSYWWPCSPDDAAAVYDVYDAPVPVLASTWQSPGCLYRGEHGALNAVLSQGDCCGLWINWLSYNRPACITDDELTNNSKSVNIYNNCSTSPDLAPVYYFDLRAGNSNGYSYWLRNQPITSSPEYRGGGCPYIFVQDIDSNYYPDNNILHRSEFAENSGVDIKDLYKLNINPLIVDGNIQLKVIETTKDYNYLDKLRLFAVDHLEGTTIGVTESNQIVVYDTTAVTSSGRAYWDKKENVTKYIRYNYAGDTVVTGSSGDGITAGTMDQGVVPPSSDSLALIISVGRNEDTPINPIVNKDFAGDASIYVNSLQASISKRFARREKNSEVIIPYAPISSHIDSAKILWNRNFQLTYLASVPVSFTGYILTELPLIEATHPNYDDALPYLLSKDNMYVELDSLYQLSLTFNNIGVPQNGYVRDYIFETDGRYSVSGQNSPLRKNNINILIPSKFNLEQNGLPPIL